MKDPEKDLARRQRRAQGNDELFDRLAKWVIVVFVLAAILILLSGAAMAVTAAGRWIF